MCFVTAKNTWGGGGQSMWGGWGQFWKFDTCGSLSGDRAAGRCFPGRPHGHIGQQGDTYTLDRGCAFLPKKTGALFLNTELFPVGLGTRLGSGRHDGPKGLAIRMCKALVQLYAGRILCHTTLWKSEMGQIGLGKPSESGLWSKASGL